jgi:restriction modification system DNA specificity domain protein
VVVNRLEHLPEGIRNFFLTTIIQHGSVPLFTVLKKTKRTNAGMQENNLLSLSYGQIIRKDIHTDTGLLPASFETYQIVEAEQIIFRFTDLQNDRRSLRSALCTERGIITSAYLATEVISNEFLPQYLNYLFRAYDLSKIFYGMGGGVRQSLSFADIARLPIPMVPLDTQMQIVSELDSRLEIVSKLSPASKGAGSSSSAIERFVAIVNEGRDAHIVRTVLGGR